MAGALGHDRGAETGTEIVGQFIKLGIAVDLDRLASGIADDIAVVAPGEVVVEFGLSAGVQHAVEVIG